MIVLSLVMTFVGCVGRSPDEGLEAGGGGETSEQLGDSDTPGLVGEGVPWVDKSMEERESYMQWVVLPEMRDLFVAYDSTYEGQFSCANCHGDVTDYFGTMPNTGGPPALSMSDGPSASSGPDRVASAEFMSEVVVPAMAVLLEVEVSGGGGAEGLSCGSCHVVGA